ncbi:protein-glutamate methylesterase/protein-glutamine glutaminase [Motiliproteus sediminis]|uniref:protein-glutamate methylesterase/protein-glutamine glutaminase n=1 Tax=Motiliproteus sediminis TaxID=1468178 RepID=UPI001AEF685C|nr:chemotaxis response regulator protein-glutamate methylesterase [Motiliproteus sediminis]
MPVKVLVVDDSAFFRQRVAAILNSDPRVELVGTAENGRVAIDKTRELKPDVITMDYEMPVMNGIAALAEIMRSTPTPVLMFSSLTYEGARITLEALDAGAVDFLPKSYEQMAPGKGKLEQVLIERILAVSRTRMGGLARSAPPPPSAAKPAVAPLSSRQPAAAPAPAASRPTRSAPRRDGPAAGSLAGSKCGLVIIGTSTGGPVAVQKILTQLPSSFPKPILIVQHMPKAFTGAFAERLNQQCQISVREAQDGDMLRPGLALLAPGGQQMLVEARGGGRVRIVDGDERLNYKPSVDVTFGSAARELGAKVLGIVLTGMGADGREGARMLKRNGSQVWAQNEESCVIFGMPQAIIQAELADYILDLNDVSATLQAVTGN